MKVCDELSELPSGISLLKPLSVYHDIDEISYAECFIENNSYRKCVVLCIVDKTSGLSKSHNGSNVLSYKEKH